MSKNATKSPRRPRREKSAASAADDGDVRTLARAAALAALRRLADLSRSEDERIALAATQELLNRAFGKTAAGPGDEPAPTRPLVIKIVRFSEVGGDQEE